MIRDEVVASKQYLSAIGHWPKIPGQANPQQWLDAFDPQDEEHAVALLDSLVFFSAEQTTKLCISAFHALSSEIGGALNVYAERKAAWIAFVNSCLISFPTGESPNPTDSGHSFARLVRQELEFSEDRFVYPEQAVERLHRGEPLAVVLVDDFAGSGNQFLETFRRQYPMPDGTLRSFETVVAEVAPADVYYLPCVATSYAVDRIRSLAPAVHLRAAHILNDHYSATHADSAVFPEHLRATAADFVARASARAGVAPNCALGFHGLALAIAFAHCVPDATLPILWADTPTWDPLLRRS